MADEDETGYLFRDGKIINFEKILENNIDYQRETGALRIRTTLIEVDVDFLEEIKPTEEQLNTIKRLKTPNRKLFFEIIDKGNKTILGRGGFNAGIIDMEKQIEDFYNKN